PWRARRQEPAARDDARSRIHSSFRDRGHPRPLHRAVARPVPARARLLHRDRLGLGASGFGRESVRGRGDARAARRIGRSSQGDGMMDIVDAQVHLGPGGASEMVAAMDAIGIKAAMIDEWWVGTPGHPGYTLANGAYRPVTPTTELAAWQYPGRFSY